MKFDITRQQPFSSLVTLFVTSIIGFFILLSGSHSLAEFVVSDSVLGVYVTELQHNYRVWSAIIASVALMLSATWLGQMISVHSLYGGSTSLHLPLLGVLLWSTLLGGEPLLASLVLTLVVVALGSLYIASRGSGYISALFDASFALSILPLLYSPSIILWVAMPLILIFVGATLREWVVAVVGLMLPFCLVSYIYWLFGYDFLFVGESLLSIVNTPSGADTVESIPIFRCAIVVISLLLALLSLFWFRDALPRTRGRLYVTYTLFVASLLTLLFTSVTALSFVLVAPMAATLLSLSLVRMRGLVVNIIYVLLLVLLLCAMFSPIYLPLEQLKSLLQ
ncbi:MAG: hypothetical protein SNI51_06900 [Rikenellaceae bacterium]